MTLLGQTQRDTHEDRRKADGKVLTRRYYTLNTFRNQTVTIIPVEV